MAFTYQGNFLIWEDTNSIEEGHRIYRSESVFDDSNRPSSALVDLEGGNHSSYLDETAVEETAYFYQVEAYTPNFSKYSEVVQMSGSYDVDDIAHYSFDGDVLDKSGNNNDLTVNGNITFETGALGNAISGTSSTSDYLITPFTVSNIITVSVWIYFDASTTAFKSICGGRSSGLSNGLGIDYTSNEFHIEDNEVNGTLYTTSDLSMFNNESWNHVVYDWTNNSLYINGNSIITNNQNIGATNPSSDPWYIATGYMNGDLNSSPPIDQFRIFDRALDESEIQILYNEITV